MESVYVRKTKPSEVSERPELYALQNGHFEMDSSGKSVFVACEPVAESLASDFDVIENFRNRGLGSVAPMREVLDPVDFPDSHPELFNV